MATTKFQASRRQFLQAAGYASVLSVGGVSSLALANTKAPVSSKTITLVNHSDQAIRLDANQPVSLGAVSDWMVVNINKTQAEQGLYLAAGAKASFEVEADFAQAITANEETIVITNAFGSENNMVPVATFA